VQKLIRAAISPDFRSKSTPKAASKAARLLKFAKITAEWTTAPSAEDVLRRDEERLLSDPA
jgi:ATP-dependent RNA helicase DeaD